MTTKQRFKGKLPYTLETTSKIVRYDPPTHFQVHVRWSPTRAGARADPPEPVPFAN